MQQEKDVQVTEQSAHSSELKVIGAGFGRTGTLSLKVALEELGFGPCYHMTEVFSSPEDVPYWVAATDGEAIDWDTLLEGYRAIVDWPGCAFYTELMQMYPDAKVLLSVRDPERWYESVKSTIYLAANRFTRPGLSLIPLIGRIFFYERVRVGRMIQKLVWQKTFDGKFEDKDYAIAVFNQHIEEVKQRVPPDKLLVYNVKEGWEPLCAFLGVEVPKDKPFPHLNDQESFIGNVAWRQNRQRMVRTVVGVSVLVGGLLFFFGRRRTR